LTAILIAVFFPFLAALAVPLFVRRLRRGAAWIAMAAPLASLYAVFGLHAAWRAGGMKPLHFVLPWLRDANVELAFRVDGLSLMWGFLVAGMGALIVLYSHWYMRHDEALGRYYAFLIAFMGSMLGVVFSDHLIGLFVFWELTSITSYFLIGYWHDREASVYGAQKAMLITGGGGLAMLGGFLLVGQATGEWRISALLAGPGAAGAVSSAAFVLILIGAASKSAQWPFHVWLPNAMEAPTPISAFLHSATMVKAGIFLLMRLYPLLGGHPLWGYAVTALGMTTMIAGGLLSLRANDLKAILAYGTISQLGLIVTFLGYGGETGVIGATLHLYNHAAAKAAMFMAVGIIDHESGTRDIRLLSGLARTMPLTHILTLLAALSLIGVPPLGGFLTKEMLYEASLHPGGPGAWGAFWPWLTLGAGIVTALYHLRFLGGTFWQQAGGRPPKHPHDPPRGMLLAPALLAAGAFLLGVAPGLVEPIAAPAAAATLGGTEPLPLRLALWHGVNLPLLMSMVTLIAGAGLYAGFAKVAPALDAAAALWRRGPGPDKAYDGSLRWARERTWGLLTLLQDGNLRRYLRWTMVAPAAILLLLAPQLPWGEGLFPAYEPAGVLPWLLCPLIAALAFATALFTQRIPAILALGGAGYAISALYLLLKAPDLALTQIMIESASVILFLIVFRSLPELAPGARGAGRKARDWAIALGLGTAAAAVMALAMNGHQVRTIADYFMRTSKPVAGFKNVVNAIIVDYRGYDTLGEITVLAIAGIAIYAMIRLAGEVK